MVKSQGPKLRSCFGDRATEHVEIRKACLKSVSEHRGNGLMQDQGVCPDTLLEASGSRSPAHLSARGGEPEDSHWPFWFHGECKKE